MSMQLPVELYRNIVDHVNGLHDLFSLSTTSRSLGYEAERALYRELRIDLKPNQPLGRRIDLTPNKLLLALNARVVDHVTKLHISPIKLDGPSPLSILQSVKNLKSLHLAFDGFAGPFLDYCPRDAPFQLQHLSIENHRGDLGLKSFIQSQRQITRFHCKAHMDMELSPNDFPALISFSAPSHNIILSLLPSGRIRHLQCGLRFPLVVKQLKAGTVLTTVRALSVGVLEKMDLVAAIFTHLEYLEAETFNSPELLSSIAQFTKLKKLKTRLPSKFHVDHDANDPSELFTRNTALEMVEVWPGKQVDGVLVYSGLIYQRGILTPRTCHSLDHDEWWKW